MEYHCFLSYSHEHDAQLSAIIHDALQRFAKPILSRRSVRVFRDTNNLSLNPQIWPAIVEAMDQSEYLLLFASPNSAQSRWVQREVSHWLSTKSSRTILVLLTNGCIQWDHEKAAINWAVTNSICKEFGDSLGDEPYYIDLSWYRSGKSDAKDPRLLDAIATISSALLGRPKDDLIGEDLRQLRKLKRLSAMAVITMLTLTLASLGLAFALYKQRKVAESEALSSTQVSNFLVTLFDLADSTGTGGREVPAREILDSASRRIEKELEYQPLIQARLLATMSLSYYGLGYHKEAEKLARASLAIRRNSLPKKHPDIAVSLNLLSLALDSQSRYSEAFPYCREALEIRRSSLGMNNSDTAESFNNLAFLLQMQGKYSAALPYHREALDIRRRVLGSEDPVTAESINNIGGLLKDMGRLQESLPYFQEALGIWEKKSGEDDSDTPAGLTNVGSVLRDLGRLEESRRYLERALIIRKRVMGERHADTALSLYELGLLLEKVGDFRGARERLREALDIFEEKLGEAHPLTVATKKALRNIGLGSRVGQVDRSDLRLMAAAS